MNKRILPVVLLASCLAVSVAARAADSSTPANNPPAATKTDVAKTDAAAPAAPAPLVVYFDMGSTTIRNDDTCPRPRLSGLQRRQAYRHDPDWHR
jgi:hypothetical protein